RFAQHPGRAGRDLCWRIARLWVLEHERLLRYLAGRARAGSADRWSNYHPGVLTGNAAASCTRPGSLGAIHVHRGLERVCTGKLSAQRKRYTFQPDLRARSLLLARRFPHAMGLLRSGFRGCFGTLDHPIPVCPALLPVWTDYWQREGMTLLDR